MGKTTHYVLDWYANKNLILKWYNKEEELKVWDKLVYYIDEVKWKKKSIGTYIGTGFYDIEKEGHFIELLSTKDIKAFDNKQKEALKVFPTFKKMFKGSFPTAIPVTAKYHMYSKQLYFYFYADERFQFTEFLRWFRREIWQNFFLFQVGARDLVKMSPSTDDIVGCNGKNLCCKSHRPLPSVNVEALLAQHLEWRDVERLKGRCGKLKCSLLYEVELYLDENKKYPQKWTNIESVSCDTCGVVTWYNIMNGLISARDSEGTYFELPLNELKQDYKILKNKSKKYDEKRISRE